MTQTIQHLNPSKLGDWVETASTLIPVPRLVGDKMLFEMDAIAAIPR